MFGVQTRDFEEIFIRKVFYLKHHSHRAAGVDPVHVRTEHQAVSADFRNGVADMSVEEKTFLNLQR